MYNLTTYDEQDDEHVFYPQFLHALDRHDFIQFVPIVLL